METVQEAIKAVDAVKPDVEVRIVRRIEIGSAIQQGDVYLFRVSDDHAKGKQIGKGKKQIAVGSHIGARHVAKGAVTVYEGVSLPDGVKSPMNVETQEICGPVIVATDTFSLIHPEHAHHELPAGTYQVTYQLDMRTMRRVVD